MKAKTYEISVITYLDLSARAFETMKKHKIINVKGPEKQENEIPNSLFICFTCVVFVSGLDFGFSKTLKKNVQILLNSYRRFLSTLFITAIFIQIVYKIKNAQLTASYWLIYGLIQYILHVIFIHLSTYNLYYFFIDMNSVGTYYTKVNKNEHNSMVNLFIIAFWISCISKGVFCYLFCTSEMDECKTLYIPGYIYCDIIIGLDVITLVQILIYYYIYKAAKYLNVALEEKGIKWARKHFTAIADICDKITPIYGRLVSPYFVFYVLIYLMHVFDIKSVDENVSRVLTFKRTNS